MPTTLWHSLATPDHCNLTPQIYPCRFDRQDRECRGPAIPRASSPVVKTEAQPLSHSHEHHIPTLTVNHTRATHLEEL